MLVFDKANVFLVFLQIANVLLVFLQIANVFLLFYHAFFQKINHYDNICIFKYIYVYLSVYMYIKKALALIYMRVYI